MVVAGFTGTTQGMAEIQGEKIRDWITYVDVSLHHGMCVGADFDMELLARRYALSSYVVGHPGVTKGGRVWLRAELSSPDDIRAPKPFIERNHDIVDETDVLWAAPKEYFNKRREDGTWTPIRSGTWATIRYAERVGKPVVIFWPGGGIERG